MSAESDRAAWRLKRRTANISRATVGEMSGVMPSDDIPWPRAGRFWLFRGWKR